MGSETKIQWCDHTFNPCENGREVPGFEAYRVTPDGTVWSCWSRGGRQRRLTDSFRVKRPYVTSKGHRRVELRSSDGRTKVKFMVHRLVLELFVGPCPEGMEGCHNDGDPSNNRVCNLRWDTRLANRADRKAHGRNGDGVQQAQAKLTDDAVRDIRSSRKRGVLLRVLATKYGVSVAKIGQVATGKNWRHVNG